MKQVFLIIVLLLAVLAGYLYFYEPDMLNKLLGKESGITEIKDDKIPTIKKVAADQPNPDLPKPLLKPPAVLNLPEDGMTYYINGSPVSGSTIELQPGKTVVLGYRDGSFRHEILTLDSGQNGSLSADAMPIKAETQWDSFQGGNLRTGLIQAGDRQNLEVVWKGHLGHKVQSSPIVVDQVAYFASSQHLLNALDLSNGKLLWSEGTMGSTVTPIVNDQFGFAGDNLGAFTGFRLKDGKAKGTARLDSYALSLGRMSPEAFMAVTRSNSVYSIQTRKGVFGKLPLDINWEVEVPELRGSQATPLFTQNAAIFQTEGFGLLALSLADGSRLWPQVDNVSSETFDIGAQSFVRDDVFLTPTPASDGQNVFGLQDGALVSLDAATGAEQWRHVYQVKPCSSLSLAYGMVLYGAGEGTVRAHSAVDGSLIYAISVGKKPVFASPVVFADKLLIANGEGKTLLLDVFSGAILTEDETLVGAGIDATPAATSDGILVMNRRGDMVFYR